jgi:phosphoglycerate dehydrogenase-like enzyme
MHIVVGKEVDQARLEDMRSRFPAATFSSVIESPDSIKEADAYIGRIPAEVYASASDRLKWVHGTGAGVETILAIPELVASDIVVTNTRGAHAPFVAEHTFALLLAVNRHLDIFAVDKTQKVYRNYGGGLSFASLYGKRMLIVGMGNIGRAIAQRALAFDMEVVGVDLFAPETSGDDVQVLPLDHLDHELALADVVVVAVPYTSDTHDLLNAERIGSLKPGAVIVGISRGNIINEEALAARLADGSLFGAGLDVFSKEPLPEDSVLWDAPNLVMSPHCAPASPLTRNREFDITYDNIERFLQGQPLRNVCDKAAGF